MDRVEEGAGREQAVGQGPRAASTQWCLSVIPLAHGMDGRRRTMHRVEEEAEEGRAVGHGPRATGVQWYLILIPLAHGQHGLIAGGLWIGWRREQWEDGPLAMGHEPIVLQQPSIAHRQEELK